MTTNDTQYRRHFENTFYDDFRLRLNHRCLSPEETAAKGGALAKQEIPLEAGPDDPTLRLADAPFIAGSEELYVNGVRYYIGDYTLISSPDDDSLTTGLQMDLLDLQDHVLLVAALTGD